MSRPRYYRVAAEVKREFFDPLLDALDEQGNDEEPEIEPQWMFNTDPESIQKE